MVKIFMIKVIMMMTSTEMTMVMIVMTTNIGTNHVFSCINIRRVPRKVFENEPAVRVFKHLPRDPATVNARKNMVGRYSCINLLYSFAAGSFSNTFLGTRRMLSTCPAKNQAGGGTS